MVCSRLSKMAGILDLNDLFVVIRVNIGGLFRLLACSDRGRGIMSHCSQCDKYLEGAKAGQV